VVTIPTQKAGLIAAKYVLLTIAAMLAFAANSLLCRLALGQQLIDAGITTDEEIQLIQDQVQATLDEAVQFAASSPQPQPESALEGVYFQTHEGSVF